MGTAAVLAAADAVKAAKFVPEKRNFGKAGEEKIDAERALKNLSKAISIPTVSYAEKEKIDFSQFERFHKFLEEAYPLVHKTLSREVINEANLIYRWKGTKSGLDPVALLSHQDVVPVTEGTEGDWKHPPFEGFNDGEFIWGRGALDMKNHLIGVMEAVETLLEEGFVPERDVYLLFGQNEEVVAAENGGALAIMETLKARGIRLDSILDEGGAILPLNIKGILDNKELVGVGIAEKGYADYEITVNAAGGHSSQPPNHSALGELANVIRDLENHQFKAKIMPFIEELFSNIGRNCSYPARLIACNVPLLKPLIKEAMKRLPPAACLVRTTTAATMAKGSPAPNVLPQKASVIVNFRQAPGVTAADIEKHIRRVCRNKNIEIKALHVKEASALSPVDSRAFKAIEEICMQDNPNAIIAPYLVMGGTDACRYEPICKNVYRFAPYRVTVELLRSTHGTNERIPVRTVAPAAAFFKRYIRKVSAEN